MMKRYSTADLRKLEIVNLCDGTRIGYADDFEFEADSECGRMLALVVSGCGGIFGLGKQDDLIIPWRMIECIGEDTILVRLPPTEFPGCICPHKPRKKRL